MRLAKPDSKQQISQQSSSLKNRLQRISIWVWFLTGVVIFAAGLLMALALEPQINQPLAEDAVVIKPPVTSVHKNEATALNLLAEPDSDDVILKTVISHDLITLDPALAVDTVSAFFIRQMFVGLTGFDEEANVVPALATDWEMSEDGLQWIFHLRDDLKWVHRDPDSGEFENLGPVTAQDVVYGITRTLDPRTASDYAYVLYIIAGAEALHQADPKAEDFADLILNLGVTAPDETTVVINLEKPAAYFPAIAGVWITYPQPRTAIRKWGQDWTQAGLIVTNGPYTLRQWTPGSEIWLEKNPSWIEADEIQIERFGGPITNDAARAMAMYENNEIDLMADPGHAPPLVDMDRIYADPQLNQELFTAPRLCTYYYGFIHKPPFDNPLTRKAFSAAINRTDLIKNVIKGGQIPAHSFSSPGVFGNVTGDMSIGNYMIEANYEDQVAQARLWLAEAGYPQGQGLEIELGYNTSGAHARIAQAIKLMWLEAFPQAKITLKSQDWPAYIDMLKRNSPDEDKPHIYRMGWCADYPDANNWLNDAFNSKSGSNYAQYHNPTFDALVEKAASETDPARRLDLYRQAEDIFINQDAPMAPIFYYAYNRLHKPWLTKVVLNPVIGDPIAKWRIDWEAKKAALNRE